MRIGIDGILLGGENSGAIRRTQNMASALADLGHEVVLYTSSLLPPRHPLPPKFRVVSMPIPVQSVLLRTAAERALLPRQVDKDRLDLMEFSHYPVPSFQKTSLLCTIHDLRHLCFSKHSPRSKKWLSKPIYSRAFSRARWIVTVSEFTRAEVLQRFSLSPEKVIVVPNAADHLPEPKIGMVRDKAVLFVGHLEPRKNLGTLLSAFAKLKKRNLPHRLQIVGRETGKHTAQIRLMARELGLAESIDWLGPVDEPRLLDLYSRAEFSVFPSLYEGFGIPLLESMRCRSPVLASDIPAHREIGAEACLYARTEDANDFAMKMERLCSEPELREKLARKGQDRETLFRWSKSAVKLLQRWVTSPPQSPKTAAPSP